jgi:broad specificity phosphatase PhoE
MSAVFPIVLMRHFPTQDDFDERYTAVDSSVAPIPIDTDIVNSLHGQLLRISQRLGISKIYCADNNRALQTAHILAEGSSLSVSSTPLLRNISCSQWAGLTEHEAERAFPSLYQLWHTRPLSVRFNDGESLTDVADRLVSFLGVANSACVVITHTTPFQVLICLCLGISLDNVWRFKPEHFAFTVIHDQVLWALNASNLEVLTFKL